MNTGTPIIPPQTGEVTDVASFPVVQKMLPATLMVSNIGAGESVAILVSLDGGDTFEPVFQDGVALVMDNTSNSLSIQAPVLLGVTKTATTLAVGVSILTTNAFNTGINTPINKYAAGGINPDMALVPRDNFYWTSAAQSTFDGITGGTFLRSTTATFTDGGGLLDTAAIDEARVAQHIAGARVGMLDEDGATNLLLNSDTLSTQVVTVAAVPNTLHFTGTGTVTLTGASTAGPLVGTGTGEANRVILTFTPTAGALTLTVSGSVTFAQLEAEPIPSSYIPTTGSTVARAADDLRIPAAVTAKAMADKAGSPELWVGTPTLGDGWTDLGGGRYACDGTQVANSDLIIPGAVTNGAHFVGGFKVTNLSAGNVKSRVGGTNGTPLAADGEILEVITGVSTASASLRANISFVGEVELISSREVTMHDAISSSMRLLLTYADLGAVGQSTIYDRRVDVNNRITVTLDTDGAKTGTFTLTMVNGGVSATVSTAVEITPGNNVTANLAWSMDGSGIGIALNGTDATQATAIGVPDLTPADVEYLSASAIAVDAENLEWFAQIESAGRVENTS